MELYQWAILGLTFIGGLAGIYKFLDVRLQNTNSTHSVFAIESQRDRGDIRHEIEVKAAAHAAADAVLSERITQMRFEMTEKYMPRVELEKEFHRIHESLQVNQSMQERQGEQLQSIKVHVAEIAARMKP